MHINKAFLLLLFLAFLTSCKTSQQEVLTTFAPEEKPKNIILMIGDGMGLAQISAAMYSNNNHLNLEKFPVIGFHKSHAYDRLKTDSAAGATAFSCGVKTYNNAIGVDKDTIPCKTILEEAEENGLSTGMVATSSIVHATPAAFIAHQKLRVLYEEIASDFLNTEIDFIVGGGKRYFDRRDIDERDLYSELVKKGYYVSDYSEQELYRVVANTSKNFVYFTADQHPLPVTAGRDYLSFASQLAVKFLSQRSNKGFFLMVEGSQIDWGGHANDGKWVIRETLDFDRAVGYLFNYAKKHGDTLIIVTADHETGGMALNPGSKMGKVKSAFTTNDHTATLVPVFAYGPSAKLFSGIYDNTEIHTKMRRAFGFRDSAASR